MKYSESWASFQPRKPLPRPIRSRPICRVSSLAPGPIFRRSTLALDWS
jgi:hypothetical protein